MIFWQEIFVLIPSFKWLWFSQVYLGFFNVRLLFFSWRKSWIFLFSPLIILFVILIFLFQSDTDMEALNLEADLDIDLDHLDFDFDVSFFNGNWLMYFPKHFNYETLRLCSKNCHDNHLVLTLRCYTYAIFLSLL